MDQGEEDIYDEGEGAEHGEGEGDEAGFDEDELDSALADAQGAHLSNVICEINRDD
jgi:hypothetical protein